ncbi:YggT family protein [Chitinibacter bivalviorum]|uniref:YggT family protein n=1 Tax=Chitinibacter bivalviorum TaxID=2739434 RepID=A0A7H9BFI1_9NEIS|nr:YggT family protein [Chitinibacter bivalviorum]QLG86948.1 YggT family protein [Chitinibacter bivalviorum]
MLTSVLDFLIRNLLEFLILLLLARFYLQAAKVSFRHPLGQFVLALTNWVVLPVRKIIPPIKGYDTTSLMMAWITAFVMHSVLLAITPWPFDFSSGASIVALVLTATLELIKMSLYLLFAAVIGQALMSWLSPYNPLMPTLTGLTAPFLRPIQKIIPPIGGVDISPLLLILVIQLILNVVIAQLEPMILQSVRMIG